MPLYLKIKVVAIAIIMSGCYAKAPSDDISADLIKCMSQIDGLILDNDLLKHCFHLEAIYIENDESLLHRDELKSLKIERFRKTIYDFEDKFIVEPYRIHGEHGDWILENYTMKEYQRNGLIERSGGSMYHYSITTDQNDKVIDGSGKYDHFNSYYFYEETSKGLQQMKGSVKTALHLEHHSGHYELIAVSYNPIIGKHLVTEVYFFDEDLNLIRGLETNVSLEKRPKSFKGYTGYNNVDYFRWKDRRMVTALTPVSRFFGRTNVTCEYRYDANERVIKTIDVATERDGSPAPKKVTSFAYLDRKVHKNVKIYREGNLTSNSDHEYKFIVDDRGNWIWLIDDFEIIHREIEYWD